MEGSHAIIAKIIFIDDSILYIRDFLFLNGERKYSYHWQNKNNDLLIRWDNSPHHFHIKTFSHHKHIKDNVVESKEIDVRSILKHINNQINKHKKNE